ncbi:hypothetical protein AAMO2058_001023400, partial [Amorphochlora amoebiformis]
MSWRGGGRGWRSSGYGGGRQSWGGSRAAPKEEKENDTIYVSGLPKSITVEQLEQLFGSIGKVKKRRGKGHDRFNWYPVIKIYKDRETGIPKGDATVSYEDPHSAGSAPNWFHNKEHFGGVISVQAATKNWKATQGAGAGAGAGAGGHGGG